jgi:hypothetical protein
MPYYKKMLNSAQTLTQDTYKPYSTNAEDYVAGFSPLQQQAQTSAAGLQVPGQFAPATQMAGVAGIGQLGSAQTALGYGDQGYQSGQTGQGIGIAGGLESAQQALNYGGQGSDLGNLSALTSANQAGQQQAQAGMYGAQGMDIGMGSALASANQAGQQQAQAGMYGGQGAEFGQDAANVGSIGGLGYGAQSADLGMQAAGMAGQGYGAGAQYAQQATDPNSVGAYMSPYMQNVMAQQVSAANRQYDITGAQQQGQATQAGAFGGTREALMASENERNRNTAIGGIYATGLQNAYTAANANQQFGANLGLQGMQAGNQAMQTGLQGYQQGLSGVNTALQGYQQGVAGAQAGLQGVQAQTNASQMQQQGANQALQGAQIGLSGVQAQTNASQMQQAGMGQALQGVGYGLQGVSGAQAGINQAMAGTQQGMAGAQAGLQGVQGAQQGYAGSSNTAATLGNLGTAELAAQTGVMNTQNTIGGQQQAQQQQAINQAILNYQNAQQYPYMQLGFMSDLLHGTQTGNTTQTQYQAQPGMASQIGGLAATGLGAYAALKADGGAIKDKGYAKGGIVGYKLGGSIEESMRSKLEDLDRPRLQAIIQKNESAVQTGLAKEVLATKLAKGGIVAFASDKGKPDGSLVDEQGNPLLKRHEKRSELQERAGIVANKTDMGIGAAPIVLEQAEPVVTPVATPVATPVQPAGIPLPQRAVVPAVQSDELDALMAQKQKTYDEAKKEADIPIEDRIQQRKDLEERFLGKDTGTEAYRADLAKQKADAPDELRQQMGMRLMEFGANWASTPGAPLVAGMKALRETLPSVMKDTKENKAMIKDLDKSTYMLEHSIRLDAMGQIDAAAAEREKAAAKLMKHDETITTLAVDKYRLDQTVSENAKNRESQEYQQKIAAGATVEAAKARSGSRADSLVALGPKIVSNDKAMVEVNKKLNRYLSSPEYAAKNADKVTELKKELVVLKKRDSFYKNEINMAEEVDTENASETSVETAPPAAIEYLKANPNAKEQFKQKFGYLPEGM